jgi:hypothetical protein
MKRFDVVKALRVLQESGLLAWKQYSETSYGCYAEAKLEIRLCCSDEDDSMFFNLIDSEDTLFPIEMTKRNQAYFDNKVAKAFKVASKVGA